METDVANEGNDADVLDSEFVNEVCIVIICLDSFLVSYDDNAYNCSGISWPQ